MISLPKTTLTAGAVVALAAAASAQTPTLNEIRIDQSGSDNDEYFELAGTPNMALDGYTYIVIGDGTTLSGTIETVVDLTGQTIQTDGLFLVGEATMTMAVPDYTVPGSNDLNFENSDNVTHLLVDGFTGALNDDLDLDDDGVLDVTPWTSIVDSVAFIETVGSGDQVYSSNQVGPDGSYVPGHIFICSGSWVIGNFSGCTFDTPGEPNLCAVASATFRADSAGANATGYTADPPVADQTWTATVDTTGTTNTYAGIGGYLGAAEFLLPNLGQYVLVNVLDPAGELLGQPIMGGAGPYTWTTTIPCAPILFGLSISTQGYSFGGTDGIIVHNAYDLVVGIM